ncbi:WD domain-containing protein [Reticulomyxa filosa]|uniref:WD domain-containing protein n=1 Tax=Reticulomyxa filosa TaxID=46433 RepID=X6NGP7_RETFI|nr:WD domain-containing protein [Reticulomyxa filosa]|eukprot:ETO25490.1 WD domain-containing protein [Reticulomyxa filosa]
MSHSQTQTSPSTRHHTLERDPKSEHNDNRDGDKKVVNEQGNENKISNGTTKKEKKQSNENANINNKKNPKMPEKDKKSGAGMAMTNLKWNNVVTPNGYELSEKEVVRVIMQCLHDLGYNESAECLSQESGLCYSEIDEHNNNNNNPLKHMEIAVANGKWDELLEWLDTFSTMDAMCVGYEYSPSPHGLHHRSIVLLSPVYLIYARILILEQQFVYLLIEHVYNDQSILAMKILQQKLSPFVNEMNESWNRNGDNGGPTSKGTRLPRDGHKESEDDKEDYRNSHFGTNSSSADIVGQWKRGSSSNETIELARNSTLTQVSTPSTLAVVHHQCLWC